LTDEQAEAYGKFAEVTTRPELERFCFLDDVDRELIGKRRGDHNRLGFALQMCTVRYVRLFVEDPLEVPLPVIEYLAEELEGKRHSELERMRRPPKRTTGTAMAKALERVDDTLDQHHLLGQHAVRPRHRARRLLQPGQGRQTVLVRGPPRRADQPHGHQNCEQVQRVVERRRLQLADRRSLACTPEQKRAAMVRFVQIYPSFRRRGSHRGSPNDGSTLFSKRVMAQIRSPARVRTNRPVPWRMPVGARR
jgi:hypothetical protein